MGLLEWRRPGGAPRHGVLGLDTTRGDRLFIALLGSAFIFLGWLAKQTTLYLGGGGALQRMRPVFIGLIVGETLAVVFWLVFSFIRAWLGMDYLSIQILPA